MDRISRSGLLDLNLYLDKVFSHADNQSDILSSEHSSHFDRDIKQLVDSVRGGTDTPPLAVPSKRVRRKSCK